MRANTGVDDAPAERVADVDAESLRIRPRSAVDGETVVVVQRVDRLTPDVDHEDPVAVSRACRIDYECSWKLLSLAKGMVDCACFRVVEISARRTALEGEGVCSAGLDRRAVVSLCRTRHESVHPERRIGELVLYRGDDRSACGHPDEWSRYAGRLSLFTENRCLDERPVTILGVPSGHFHDEPDLECIAMDDSGGWSVVVSVHNRKRSRCVTSDHRRQNEQCACASGCEDHVPSLWGGDQSARVLPNVPERILEAH